MDTSDKSTKKGLSGDELSVALDAFMLFPRDQKKRRDWEPARSAFVAQELFDIWAAKHKPLTEDQRVLLCQQARGAGAFKALYIDAFKVIRRNKTKTAPIQQSILAIDAAAQALTIPLICNLRYGRKDIGLHQAFRTILGTEQKDDPTGFRNLQKTWRHYEPVVHLLAAKQILGSKYNGSPDAVSMLLTISTYIRKWGEKYTPHRANRPLLSRAGAFIPTDHSASVLLSDVDLGPFLIKVLDLKPEWTPLIFGFPDG